MSKRVAQTNVPIMSQDSEKYL